MDLIINISTASTELPISGVLQASLGLDIWEITSHRIVARASEIQAEHVERLGYNVEELISVARYLSQHRSNQKFKLSSTPSDEILDYHTALSLEQDMQRLAASQPELVELHEVGRSVESQRILAFRIAERRGHPKKILFLGCHHAREWISVEVPYLLAKELVEDANKSPNSDLLSKGEIWVVPLVNPDGYSYTHRGDIHDARIWRKNRRGNSDNTIGVDLNRNYSYMWGTLNDDRSSKIPSSDTYIGPYPFSEPETRAIRDLIQREKFDCVVSYHSYSQLILYPWGYTRDPISNVDDHLKMSGLAERMYANAERIHRKHYEPQQASMLYPAAGTTIDWTYGVFSIPSFTIELRPTKSENGAWWEGFLLPEEQIRPTYEENRAAAFTLIGNIFDS